MARIDDAEGEELRERLIQVEEAARRAIAEEVAKRTALERALAERRKELTCLYGLSKTLEVPNLSLPEILQQVVLLLPPAWQFPEGAVACISYEGRTYTTEGFKETPWLQSASIVVAGRHAGAVTVGYLDQRPMSDEGPFLIDERRLLDAVAERLGRMLERVHLGKDADEMQSRLRVLYDQSPGAIGFSRDGITLGANPAYLRLFGYESESEIVGRPLLEQIAPSARAVIAQRIEARRRGEAAPSHYQTWGRRKDGSEFPCEARVARVDLAEGPVSAVFMDDLSERMQSAAALERNEARFRGLVEGSRDSTAVVDAAGKVTYASPNVERTTGYPIDERQGRSIFDTVHPDDHARIVSALGQLLASGPGATANLEFRAVRKDGTIWWGEANATNLLDDPSVAGVVVNYRDVSERKRAEEALRTSEARFRDIAHAHAGVVWETDEHFSMTHLSGRVRAVLGYDAEELLGQPLSVIMAVEDRERIDAVLAGLRRDSAPVRDIECWGRTKDGRRVRLSTNGVPFSSPDGTFQGVRGTHLDITELYWSRRRQDVLLRLHQMAAQDDAAISALLCEACATQTESAISFFGIVEPDGSAMVAHVWSLAAHRDCRIENKPVRFPLASAGLWAEPIRRREPVIANEFLTAEARRGLPTGHIPVTRYLGVPVVKDDRVIAVAGLANKETPYRDEDVKHVQLLASGISDFLATRNAERAVRESDRRLRTFIDFTADWEYWRRPDGTHEYDSQACECITGYSAHDFLADPDLVVRIVHPDDRAVFDAHIQTSERARSAETLEAEFRIIRKSGEVRWLQHVCRSVFETDGRFAGTRVSNRDITQQKRAEEERAQLQEQLHHAQKMEAIGTLAGGVAHDFNNILGGILGGLSLLEIELGAISDSYRCEITDMEALVQRGAELAKQLLGFSRRGKYDVRPLDVAEVASKTATMFGRTRPDIVIVQEFVPKLDAALMDHAQLEQVLLNLFLNAAHAMPGGGRLMLRAENACLTAAEAELHGAHSGRFVKLVVTDTGTGIDAANLPRIFEPFFTTKAPGQGSGLGLASVYGIIKNHGGIINVQSELGQGTAFTLLLPATDKAPAEKASAATPVRPGQGTVLVVDDEERLLHLCGRLLQALGYQVLTASTGRVAVEMVRQHHTELSLVILDLTMPEMSGAKTFEAIRKVAPCLRVLLASGASIDGQAQQLLDQGCNGFIQKPFDAAALSEKIRALR